MLGKIKGWNFLPKKLSADGSTTQDTLRAEKTRLEKRLAEIPGLITRLQNSISTLTNDITWLRSLNNRRAKDWAKENGKSVEQAIYDGSAVLVGYNANIESLNIELKRIPAQITEIDKQIAILVQGESTGLSKGIDAIKAKELGELAVEKERQVIVHNTEIKEAEIKQIELQQTALSTAKPPMSANLKWGLVIGSSLVFIAIVGYVIYQQKQALGLAKPLLL